MKKQFWTIIAWGSILAACKEQHTHFPSMDFVNHASQRLSTINKTNQLTNDSIFWKNRLSSNPINYTAAVKLSSVLQHKFQLSGNIQYLHEASGLIEQLLAEYGPNHAGLQRIKAGIHITKHQFKEANAAIQKALEIGEERRESLLIAFDTQFELGYYTMASRTLQSCKQNNDYGYLFRMFKWKHYIGETDSAIWYLQKAQEWGAQSQKLVSVARVNEADLYLHEGKLKDAIAAYKKNIESDNTDFHSWLGIAKSMIQYTDNRSDAIQLLTKITKHHALPDPYYQMVGAAEGLNDRNLQYQYAKQFADKATDSMYGAMYSKYMIDLYTGILNQPNKALVLAKAEINNRATPQTYAWLAWTLHQTKQFQLADSVYTHYVKGKPLEALELFWMGQRMYELDKKNNAQLFFEGAAKNYHDLSPGKQVQLDKLLQ
ncbi:MAG: hypothetical protein K2X37_11150 [Chitinophagaceae bacterium]|nr:hypothetical protein [Chitinophagaceae bacterium]